MTKSEKKNNPQTSIQANLICKDHLVSGEKFEIKEYQEGILRTLPVPNNLSRYYESEKYISHSDSQNNLQDKIYHLVKSYMLSKKISWIRKYFKQGSILDYGAGTGEFLNNLKKFYWDVEGVEPNASARELAILKGLNLKPDLSALTHVNYDVISLWHVLEHIPNLDTKIAQIRELLKDDGLLIIAVPNFNSYDSEYYNENWAAWDVPRHLWHFSRKGINEKFSQFGFRLVEEKPLKFDSYYVSLLSEKNKPGSSNLINAFYRGFRSNQKAKTTGEYSSITYFFKKEPNTHFKAL